MAKCNFVLFPEHSEDSPGMYQSVVCQGMFGATCWTTFTPKRLISHILAANGTTCKRFHSITWLGTTNWNWILRETMVGVCRFQGPTLIVLVTAALGMVLMRRFRSDPNPSARNQPAPARGGGEEKKNMTDPDFQSRPQRPRQLDITDGTHCGCVRRGWKRPGVGNCLWWPMDGCACKARRWKFRGSWRTLARQCVTGVLLRIMFLCSVEFWRSGVFARGQGGAAVSVKPKTRLTTSGPWS